MIERVSRVLRLVPPSPKPDDLRDGNVHIEERVELVIEKIDSLEARVEALEQSDEGALPHDRT